MNAREIILELIETLDSAKDHLEYCSYGDEWERECAEDKGLAGEIDHTLELSKDFLENNLITSGKMNYTKSH